MQSFESENANAAEASIITLLLSRNATSAGGNAKDSSTAKLTVVARTPCKRVNIGDSVKYTLEHFTFLDDKRSFANVDALLTRFAPVGSVYVACTENPEGKNQGGGGTSSAKKNSHEVSQLMNNLVQVIESRSDATPGGTDDVSVLSLPTMSRAKATSVVESSLVHLLGGETSDAYLAYRGDRHVVEEPMVSWCLGHFFSADQIHRDESDETRGSVRISNGTLDSLLSMDRTAAEAIHLLPPRSNSGAAILTGGNESNNSLFGVLNHCKSKMGSRTLEVWLRQPLVDLKKILHRQNAVAKLVEDSIGRDRLRGEGLATLRGIDLDKLTYRLTASGRAEKEGTPLGSTSKALECLYNVHTFANTCLPPLLEVLQEMVGNEQRDEEDDCIIRTSYEGLERASRDLDKAVGLAEKVIDFSRAPRDFIVNSDLNGDLDDLKDDLDGIEEELEAIHKDMNKAWAEISSKGNNQVRLENVEENSNTSCVWQFRLIDSNAEKTLKDKLEKRYGVKIHRILKNGIYFSTKELNQLGTKKKNLMEEYKEQQRDIVVKCMAVASSFVPVIERCSVLVADLDVIASLAHVAAYSSDGYCRPTMTDSEEDGFGIELKEARHPCVELQDDMNFIANDFNLIFGSSSFQIVTGPNMGGKSTYIRSLAAIVAMAQIGSFVPCSFAKINIVHHILARVGAGDAQDRGISTFMAEMLEASSILRTSTKRSLIIIDELGRGTSTFDGFGLAKAISEHIVEKIGCLCVFATHFHELTALEEQEASVTNCHVSAQMDRQNGLTFLYEVQPGPCLESFGIAVAEMANMPPSIITEAKRKAKLLENFDYRKRSKADEKVESGTLEKFRKMPVNEMSVEEMKKTLVPLIKSWTAGS